MIENTPEQQIPFFHAFGLATFGKQDATLVKQESANKEDRDGPAGQTVATTFTFRVTLPDTGRPVSEGANELFPGLDAMREESARSGHEYVVQAKKRTWGKLLFRVFTGPNDERPTILLAEAELTGALKAMIIDGYVDVEFKVKADVESVYWNRIPSLGTQVWLEVEAVQLAIPMGQPKKKRGHSGAMA